jgi:hypothetical protein
MNGEHTKLVESRAEDQAVRTHDDITINHKGTFE